MTREKNITKIIIMILIVSILLLLVPNVSKATVGVTRNVYSNNGSMKFNFTGLALDTTHDYEYGLTKTATTQVENWYSIMQFTATTATIDLMTTNNEIREVINVVDTGYITIRDKTISKIVLEPYSVDLKIPYLKVNNCPVISNGKDFPIIGKNSSIDIKLRNPKNSEAYYQYEKITDENVINKYREIKAKNGDFYELQNILKDTIPTSNWTTWSYWIGEYGSENGGGYPTEIIQAPDTGLYYLWVYFSGKNIKDIYGYILVDNLGADIALEGISLQKTATVQLGKTLTLTPTFSPSNATNKIVTWSSSDESVATVDNAGKITPKKVGSTIITVTSQDGSKKATCTVTVTATSSDTDNTNNKDKTNGQKTDTTKTNTTSTKTDDPTTAKGILPKTGVGTGMLIFMICLIGGGVYFYSKYKKLKGI